MKFERSTRMTQLDAMPNVESMENFARDFIDGSMFEQDELWLETEKGKLYRYFERTIQVPKIGEVKFCLDIKRYKPTEEDRPRPDMLQFSYAKSTDEHSDLNQEIARMDFAVVNFGEYHLIHRFVAPGLRRAGVGTNLFEAAESWLRQIANELKHPVTIHLQAGQRSVMDWARRVGFWVVDSQRDLLEEIEDHPEEFVEDRSVDDYRPNAKPVERDLYLFRNDQDGRGMKEHAERLDFIKQISPST